MLAPTRLSHLQYLLGICALLSTSQLAIAEIVTVTVPTTVGPLDQAINGVSLADAEITVVGTTLTINGRHEIRSLRLTHSVQGTPAVLTHSANATHDYSGGAGTDTVYGLWLTVEENVIVDGPSGNNPACRIDVSSRGYGPASGPGAGGTGAYQGGGGGHGGRGGRSHPNSNASGGLTYGYSPVPVTFGSGGGNDLNELPQQFYGGSGGGCVRIDAAQIIRVNGLVLSNGGSIGIYNSESGGGAGGSILMSASEILGDGFVQAEGGSAYFYPPPDYYEGGGGGGGKVALFACNIQLPANHIAAPSGAGYEAGQSGYVGISTGPLILSTPASDSVCSKGTASFSVSAYGNGPVSYRWRHDGTPLEDELGHIAGAGTSMLVITNARNSDTGLYDCVVTNPCNSEISIAATLSVCAADFDCDGFITGLDYDLYVQAFEAGDMEADFDGDGFITGVDFDLYVQAFEAGC